mgnify:CR=1 FL=1
MTGEEFQILVLQELRELKSAIKNMDSRIDKLGTRLDSLESRFDSLESRVISLKSGQEQLRQSLARIEVEHGEKLRALHDAFELGREPGAAA